MSDTAKRDQNNVPTLLAVSSVDGTSTVTAYADPTTHRLLVSSSGGGGGFSPIAFTGTVNSVNTVFTAASTPTVVVADGIALPATTSNGTVIWTIVGLVVTMANPPSFDIYGL